MSQYKLKSYNEYNSQINESAVLMMLIPVLAVVIGKLIGYTVGRFAGPQIRDSMNSLVKSRFAEKANDKDIENLYLLIQNEYPEIKDALDKDNKVKLTTDMKAAGLDRRDEEYINKVVDKLRDYHKSL